MSKESGSEKQILIKSENTDYNLLPADGKPSATQVSAPAHSPSCDTRKAEVFKDVHGYPSKYQSYLGLELGIVPPLQTSTAGGGTSVADGSLPRVCKLEPLVSSDASPPRPPVKKLKPESALQGGGLAEMKPHIFTVPKGEDVASRAMSFSCNGWAVCILSANGSISRATLRHGDSTVTYEGCFEIIRLYGSYLLSDSSGMGNPTGGFTVSLACPDGRMFGGSVAGPLTAASPVQVVIGKFPSNEKKELDLNLTPGRQA